MADPKVVEKIYSKRVKRYIVLTLILVFGAGYYCFGLYQNFMAAQAALAKEQEMLGTLQRDVNISSREYATTKQTFDNNFKPVLQSIQKVYPPSENYTELTRLLEGFFQKNNTSLNPTEFSDLKYPPVRIEQGKDYAILPVTLSFNGSEENFFKFLNFVQHSGVLEDGTRLMDIRSISINFIHNNKIITATGQQPLWNVSIALNAYFQKPVAEIKAVQETTPAPNQTASKNIITEANNLAAEANLLTIRPN